MGDIHRYRLIDCKTEKGHIGRRFVIIGGSDVGGSLHARGDRRNNIGAVDIDRVPGLKAGGGYTICLSTGDRQIGNTEC